MDTSKFVGGGFYSTLNPGAPDLPFRPPGQDVAALPPREHNYFVDQIDNGQARLVDDHGNAHMEPAKDYHREGRMEDGTLPDGSEADAIRARLSGGDNHGPISLQDVGQSLPQVPLAPGSPGPAVPPAADSFIGKTKGRKPQEKRRRTVP